ncbi:MAG TPA: MMPL family transporter, partial [Gemmatimonadaceae bacterium]|nr:MMPL family transporter [Gemmatimonadaceae bacterium]
MNRIPIRAAAAWITAALLLFPFQRRLDRSIRASSAVGGTGSAAAEARIHSGFDSPFGEPALLVVSGLAHPADSDSGRMVMREIAARLLATRAAVGVLSSGSSLDTLLVGTDRTTALAIVGVNGTMPDAMDTLRTQTASVARGNPGMTLRWTGEPALVGDLRTMSAREARRSELRALPVSIVVAVIAFGSLLDAMIAVGAAALAISVALGLMGLLS